jgi:hypothetical protein
MSEYEFKIPHEDPRYPQWSDYAIGRIAAIMQDAIDKGENKIFIHTNLKRGLPLENINKVAGPFVEAWALEKFEDISKDPNNPYELVNVQAGARLDAFDVLLQFRRAGRNEYVSSNVDVKATAEDIEKAGKSPNITSYGRIRTEYVNDPDYMFLILSLRHRVYSERDPKTRMTNGIMEVRSYNVYDLKYLSAKDISYNPALGTGQIQIRDIHYVTTVRRTTWEFCQLLDRKYLNSSKRTEADFYKLARQYGWVK